MFYERNRQLHNTHNNNNNNNNNNKYTTVESFHII